MIEMKTVSKSRIRDARIRRNRRDDMARVSRPAEPRRQIMPRWIPVAASLTLVLTITATVNVRSFMDLRNEETQNQELNNQVQQMNEENLGLQEEIFYLKNDSDTIEREAKKYGLVRPPKQVSRAGEIDKAEESINRQTPTRK